ncbi:MAG: T9SS type A sorting domain-containing protein [Bacteroidales bacterium]|nr:T9SS type A sorting domain-containing protein [Bacteroidales bacterium]
MGKILLFTLLFTSSISYSQKAVPDFSVTDIYGHTHKLYTDYLNKGKNVYINFFSVGCQSCQDLSPIVDTVYRYFGCNFGNIIFLGIDGNSYNNEVWNFTQNFSMTFPAVSGNDGGGNNVFTSYNINYFPYDMLIDNNGKIIYDIPDAYNINNAVNLEDSLIKYNSELQQRTCSGNKFLFYSLISENDSVVGNINETDKTVLLTMPDGTNLTQIRAFFVAETNSVVKVNGTEQINGETTNDFSQGAVVYDITSEDGNSEKWTVSASTSSIKSFLQKNIEIYPTLVSDVFFMDFSKLKISDARLDIFNIEGKIVKTLELNNSTSQINIADFSEGIYFLKIKVNKTAVFKKIIKQ